MALHNGCVNCSNVWANNAYRHASILGMSALAITHVQDTDRFCHQTLCDPGFVQYVSENFLCWGGDVRKSDPFTVRIYIALLHSTCNVTRL